MVQFVFVWSYDTNASAKQIVEACFASARRFYISSESEEKYAPIKRHLKVKNSPKHMSVDDLFQWSKGYFFDYELIFCPEVRV